MSGSSNIKPPGLENGVPRNPRLHHRHVIQKVKHTLEKFKTTKEMATAVLDNTYTSTTSEYYSRSLLWRSVFILDKYESGEIQSILSSAISQKEIKLHNLVKERKNYDLLLNEFQIPWNQLELDHDYFAELKLSDEFDLTDELTKRKELSRIRVTHDPLSVAQSKESKTSETQQTKNDNRHRQREMTDLQLLELLITDVERLFPQLPEYFIDNQENKKMIIELLYIWSKLNNTPYSQGLHEIVGTVFIILLNESINPKKIYKRKKHESEDVDLDDLDSQIIQLNDINFIRHDTFAIFNGFINLVISKYYNDVSLLQQSIKFDLKLHQLDQFSYILLKNKLKLDSTIWLLRYLRLLLIREIKLNNSFELWDRLIAFGYTKKPSNQAQLNITLLLPYIIILLISLIKKKLIISDYGEAMYLLLHYPILDELEDRKQLQMSNYTSSVVVIKDDSDSEEDDGLDNLNFTYVEEPIFERFSDDSKRRTHSIQESRNTMNDFDDISEDQVELDIPQLVKDSMTLYELNKAKNGDSKFIEQGTKIIERYSGMQNEVSHGKLSTSPVKKPSSFLNRNSSGEVYTISSQSNGGTPTGSDNTSSFFKNILSRKSSTSTPMSRSRSSSLKTQSVPDLGVSKKESLKSSTPSANTSKSISEDFTIGENLNIKFQNLAVANATKTNTGDANNVSPVKKDFTRTRLEMRLQKKVNEVMNQKKQTK